VMIGLAAAVVVAVFSSRLIYWHSEWQSSVRDVLAEDPNGPGGASSQVRAQREHDLRAWDVRLGECVVPDAASYAGHTLAQLSIPSRFGCAILELERNGIVITGIRPDLRLYPGDKLLLLGQADQINTACAFLTREKPARDQAEEFRGSVLETFRIPDGPWNGRALAELKLAQVTGVRVVGIQRGEQRVIAPSGEERLNVGDNVLVAGTLDEIANFRRWLRSKGAGQELAAESTAPRRA
jgi:monovalent cation:H+ antiporter-2, CPA2 family